MSGTFGPALRAYRKERGLTQGEVAHVAGHRHGWLSRRETGAERMTAGEFRSLIGAVDAAAERRRRGH